MENLLEQLKSPEAIYRPCAFWFLNHYPEKDELLRQMADIQAKGFGGLVLHAREGLRGGYLNRKWRDAIQVILEEAKRLGIWILLYDELNFPSGPAGNLLWENRPDTGMQFLELVEERRATPVRGEFDKVVAAGTDRWLCFKVRKNCKYPDYICKEDMAEFIRLSYRQYADWFKPFFGDVIKGEFTDNPCANFGFIRRAIPWTESLPMEFRRMTGRELDDILPSLFFQTESAPFHRLIFWRFLNELFLDVYVKPIEEECQRNGIAATGHYCIEQGTTEHIRQLGDRFDQKRHQHIPGVDMLGAPDFENLEELVKGQPHPLAITATSSCAYFLKKDGRTLCECFGLSAGWACTLAELRRMGGYICALGADMCVPHGLYYSIAGHRKRECVPDFMHNTLWEHFNVWSDYTARLCSLIANSSHVAETAILYPAAAQQASIELGVGTAYTNDIGTRAIRIDKAMQWTAETLVENALPFEIVDEQLLSESIVDGDTLLIPRANGERHSVRSLVLPSAWLLTAGCLKMLRQFIHQGGLIIAVGEAPCREFDGNTVREIELSGVLHLPGDENWPAEQFVESVSQNRRQHFCEVANSKGKIILREWQKDGRKFAMLHNHSRRRLEKVRVKVRFTHVPVAINLDTLEVMQMPLKGDTLERTFESGETLLLTDSDGNGAFKPCRMSSETVNGSWKISLQDAEWTITPEQDNALRLTEMTCRTGHEERIWTAHFQVSPDFAGRITLALDTEPSENQLRQGIHPYYSFFQCVNGIVAAFSDYKAMLNGHRLDKLAFGTTLDHWIYEQDVTEFIQPGDNVIEIVQPDVRLEWNNAVPEPPILLGQFAVRNGAMAPLTKTVKTLRWDKTELAGYSGTMAFSRTVDVPCEIRGKELVLELDEVHDIVEVLVNGRTLGTRVMNPYKFVIPSDMTQSGIFSLTLRVTNTPYNRWCGPRPSGVTEATLK